MIDVNVKEMEMEINRLNILIESYEETYLNLFNTINSLQGIWNGAKASKFFSIISHDKNETYQMINKIKNQRDLYQYICDKYKVLGIKIRCNLDAKDQIITKISNCIDKTNSILNIYQSIDIDIDYSVKCRIIELKNQTVQALNLYQKVMTDVKAIYLKIEELEQEVCKKAEKLEVLKIEDIEII